MTREKKDRRSETKGDEFYFHSILEYKKESQLKSRETSYIPKVTQDSNSHRRPPLASITQSTAFFQGTGGRLYRELSKGAVKYLPPMAPKVSRAKVAEERTNSQFSFPQHDDSK